jgi:hypothetical protein
MKKSLTTALLTVCMALSMSLAMSLPGCAVKQHVGSVNQFDSSTADTLHDIQGVIEGLSMHITDYPSAKPAINEAREYYTVAEKTYLQWRCAIGATKTLGPHGDPCPATVVTQVQVSTAVSNAQRSTAAAQVKATTVTGGK